MDMLLSFFFNYLLLVICLVNPIPTFLAQPPLPLPLPLPLPVISSRVTVVGAVYCDTCLTHSFSPSQSYFLPGVDVNVKCKLNANSPRTKEMISIAVNTSTDKSGIYRVDIPSVDGVDCVDGPPIQVFCQATLIGSSCTACNVPTLKLTTNALSLKSKHPNLCIYTFTALSFRPRKHNVTLCGQRQAHHLSHKRGSTPKYLPRLVQHNP